MATVNISHKFENNLRRVSEVGVATLVAEIADSGDRLDNTATYALAANTYQAYCIPADSIVTKVFFIVDEAFDAGTTLEVKTIVDNTMLVAALDVATVGATAGTLALDTYFDAADGIAFTLSADATSTGGKVRAIVEYVSLDTNNGIYMASGA